MKNLNMDLPIVIKFKNNKYKLISGESTISGCFSKGINSKIWFVDLKPYYDMQLMKHVDIETETIQEEIKKQ